MKKLMLLILGISTMIFAENNVKDDKKLKTVTCEVTYVQRQIGNFDGTRVTCVDKENKVYHFNESMVNWRELKTGKTYNIVYGQRIVKTNILGNETNLYLFGFGDPSETKVVQQVEEKVIPEETTKIEMDTVVLPFNCSNVERKCIIHGFRVDKGEPSAAEAKDLEAIANFINKFAKGGTIDFVGHTDSTASDEYNQKLSERRANSVAKLLKQYGLSDTVSYGTISGKGESEPMDTNETIQGRYNNRRVELLFYNVDFGKLNFINKE